jgi:hypothetical protein
MAKHKLGLLGPVIVLVGAAVAGVAVWYMMSAKPKAGDVIDTIALEPNAKVVIRSEAGGGKRSFIELHEQGALKWQAMIPRYAGAPGRPAVAWNERAITVRVDRDGGRAEVFAFSRATSSKIGMLRLAQTREPIRIHPEGPITMTDHVRSFELVGGADWHALIAIDLASGEGAWKAELGKPPISAAGVERGTVWVEQAGKRRVFDAATGREEIVTQTLN